LTTEDIEAVQAIVRKRLLRLFVRRGCLDPDEAKEMLAWDHGGGLMPAVLAHPLRAHSRASHFAPGKMVSVNASVRVEARDRAGLERLLRYCARPPFALERLQWADAQHRKLIYRLPQAAPDGTLTLQLSPLECIDRLAALIPPPRRHLHRYHGVLAPNAPLRAAVTPSVEDTPPEAAKEAPNDATRAPLHEPSARPSASYLWVTLLARIYEAFPLVCTRCGQPMRLIAFITDSHTVVRILDHIGEPTLPPALAPCRDPPESGDNPEAKCLDPLAPVDSQGRAGVRLRPVRALVTSSTKQASPTRPPAGPVTARAGPGLLLTFLGLLFPSWPRN
jgi:hypothetical protein